MAKTTPATLALDKAGVAYELHTYDYDPDAPRGIPTVVLITLFMGGVQLLGIAIIGEYLRRMFVEVKGRPRFVVRDVLNDDRDQQPPSSGRKFEP